MKSKEELQAEFRRHKSNNDYIEMGRIKAELKARFNTDPEPVKNPFEGLFNGIFK